MTADSREPAFQQDIVDQLTDAGWVRGDAKGYDRERALYVDDCLTYVKTTQPDTWAKIAANHPKDPEAAFLKTLTSQLSKASPQASVKDLRSTGTLGVLRHGLRDRSAKIHMAQFKPDHGLNPDVMRRYEGNILRVVPELVYSPHATKEQLAATGKQAKRWRIDLVLFLNGLPIVTMELKSDFKQALENAVRQYKSTRLSKDPETGQPEPLLTFKRGALVHFAVSQTEVQMTTRLAGAETVFLPFNRGTADGGAGNDVPEDKDEYATGYLWREVLARENLLEIIGRFIHLEIKETESWDGRKGKKETLIFPRYHQWDLVKKLVSTTRDDGPGGRYLAQHSAGSGKSNSIAWTAHQLATLHDARGERVFRSVIVVTDRTVLDGQLQRTISQIDHEDGVVGHISRDEGQGSKAEKLAAALAGGQHIVIVTIQTFPFVLDAIEDSASLREYAYAIIADEAHSSQTGRTAGKVRQVLSKEANDGDEELSAEEIMAAEIEARRSTGRISYYAFTATPKSKTLELFGVRPDPQLPASADNKPRAFHVYSMRQAIEEGYILDVLKNYTSYKVAYQLAQKAASADREVEAKRARVRLGQWVRLHDYNIAQKVKVIVEHFRGTVMGLLGGQAKAMVVTGSRKEAVRYKLEFDRYVAQEGYQGLTAMVAFSGEVRFTDQDPGAAGLAGQGFTETGMNPGLKGRDMKDAFDTSDYQVMIVAQKFQTGFDQPKLCAMYVDKKLAGLDCVQTLSRLNRTYPGKKRTYVLDFVNDPQDVLAAFQEYYETAELLDVSDPNLIWDLFETLRESGIFLWQEVTRFAEAYFKKGVSNAAISNICQPAVERWQARIKEARARIQEREEALGEAKDIGSDVAIGNAEDALKEARDGLEEQRLFKRNLISFTRQYDFMSQIEDYDDTDLERLSLYARHLAPLLREVVEDDEPIDLTSVELSHYRLSMQGQADLKLQDGAAEGLAPATAVGTGQAHGDEEVPLSELIDRLNELFVTENLTDSDLVSYANTIRDKIAENADVMEQIAGNSPQHAFLGDFRKAMDAAVMDSAAAHQNQMTQYFNSAQVKDGFRRLVFEMLLGKDAG